jgi:large subunit ribosomal protein L10
MTNEQKTQVIEETTARLEKAVGLYLVSFSGLTVEKANQLRSEFFKIGVEYKVVKNTLLKRSMQNVGGYDGTFTHLANQTGVVFAYDDPIEPARVLKKFVKDNEGKISVKACVIDKDVFDGERLNDLASLPTREDLIAGIIGTIAAPASGIVGAINAVITGIVNVVDAIEKQKQEQAA